MSFSGITFANQNATPSDDAIIRRAVLEDGILTGCAFSYTGSTLTIGPGQIILCGRQIRHPSVQNWPIIDSTTGFARIVLTIDLSKTSTKDSFEQVDASVEYAAKLDGFQELIQTDINSAGTIYQQTACVVSLSPGGISGIVSKLGTTSVGIGGSGATLTVTAPVGVTVTASMDGRIYTRTANAAGVAVFRGLKTGTWEIKISNGQQTSASVYVNVVTDYNVTVNFFSAVISVTYPSGSTCTCSKGATVFTSPDTSGRWAVTVPEAGNWVVSCTDGADTDSETVAITTDGQTAAVTLEYRLYLFQNGLSVNENISGGWANEAQTYGSTEGYSFALSKHDGYILLTTQLGPTFGGRYRTGNRIDLTNVNTIVFDGYIYRSGSFTAATSGCLRVDKDLVSNANHASAALVGGTNSKTDGILRLDVSSLTGSFYIYMTAEGGDNLGHAQIKFKSLYLE